jgi:hypothetical protein
MTAGQLVAKLVLSVPLVVLLVLVWRSPVDIGQLRPGHLVRSWLAQREPDAVYQDGQLVGRVDGVEVREPDRLVTFRAIYQTGPMAVGRPFVFRDWALQPRAIDRFAPTPGAVPGDGRVLHGVTCEILGPG